MIPPSLMNANFLFTLIPIWEQEPVPPTPCPAPTPTIRSDKASSRIDATQPDGDADGVNDQVALRMVFKGYRLRRHDRLHQAEAFAGYERFVENRSDDDEDRQRQDQRARSAVRSESACRERSEQPGTTPSAPSDSAKSHRQHRHTNATRPLGSLLAGMRRTGARVHACAAKLTAKDPRVPP